MIPFSWVRDEMNTARIRHGIACMNGGSVDFSDVFNNYLEPLIEDDDSLLELAKNDILNKG